MLVREKLCVLCGLRPATRHGEHVLPKWYMRDRGPGPGPYPWTINGKPILDWRGRPIAPTERVRVQLPTCSHDNATMNRRFEVPAKETLRRLFASRGAIALAPDELRPVALWFLKTLLLLARPEAQYQHPKIDPYAIRWDTDEVPHGYYEWLIDGQAPPPGVSLWMFRADERRDDRPTPTYRVPLPTVDADGSRIDFVCFQMTFHGVQVTLVVHPGWDIRHPLENDNAAVRLWPGPPSSGVNLAALPVLPSNAVSWFRCRVTLRSGVLGNTQLPPLGHTPNLLAYLPTMAPFIESWGA